MAGPLDALLLPARALAALEAIAQALGELPALTRRVDAIGSDVHHLRRELRELPAQLDRLEAGLEPVRSDLRHVLENVRPMDEDLSSVERAVKELNPRFEDVREQLEALRTDLSGLPFVKKTPKEEYSS
jgi:chromosome segregation ATPase